MSANDLVVVRTYSDQPAANVAKTALDALPVVWDEGDNAKVSSATIAEVLKAGLDADQAFVGNQNGDAKAALASAAKKVEAVYAYPFQNHACMEPMNEIGRAHV